MKKVCFIVTDAVSFNVLYRGQFEFFKDSGAFSMTFIAGGSRDEISKFNDRDLGQLVDVGFVRNPSLFQDVLSLLLLLKFLIFNRFDLIVYSTPKALLLGSLASFLSFHRKRIALIHGRVYENYTGFKRKFFEFLDKVSLGLSCKALFVSESLRQCYIDGRLVSLNKSMLLGLGSCNGVDTQVFKPVSAGRNVFTVLVVGRVCKDKGFYDLIELLKIIHPTGIEFKIVGAVEGEDIQAVLNEVLQAYPFVSHYAGTDSVAQFFQQADLHLFLTHREGFGNVAIEAASCGVPTFAYQVVGVKDSVAEGISGKHFSFGDIRSVADAINASVVSPDFHLSYPRARHWVVENFRQEKVWVNYLEFYRSY